MLLPANAINDPLTEFSAQLAVLNHLADGLRHNHRSRSTPVLPIAILPAEHCTENYTQLLRGVAHGVRSMTRMPLIGAPLWRQTAQVAELLRSGKKWRDIYDADAIHSDGMLRHLHEVGALGEVSRTLPTVPIKLVIGDDDIALLVLHSTEDQSVQTLQIGPCNLLGDIVNVFETLWSFATPIPDRTCTSSGGMQPAPAQADLELLSLLAAGATDEAIARQLGTSLRTVQRRVRRVEDMLGARTRFQAGIQAARRNLI